MHSNAIGQTVTKLSMGSSNFLLTEEFTQERNRTAAQSQTATKHSRMWETSIGTRCATVQQSWVSRLIESCSSVHYLTAPKSSRRNLTSKGTYGFTVEKSLLNAPSMDV